MSHIMTIDSPSSGEEERSREEKMVEVEVEKMHLLSNSLIFYIR